MAKLSSGHAPAFMPIGDGAWVFCQQVTSFASLNFCQSLCELTKVSIRPQPWGCWKTFHQHHATRHGDVSAPQDLCRRDLNRLWRIHKCSWHIHDQGLDALLLCNEPDALWMAVSRIHGGRLIPMFEVFFCMWFIAGMAYRVEEEPTWLTSMLSLQFSYRVCLTFFVDQESVHNSRCSECSSRCGWPFGNYSAESRLDFFGHQSYQSSRLKPFSRDHNGCSDPPTTQCIESFAPNAVA